MIHHTNQMERPVPRAKREPAITLKSRLTVTEISQRTLVRKTLPRNGRERPAVQQFNADVRLVVVSPSGAPDHYSAHDYRGRLLVASSRQPLPDSCRVLLSEGADPNAWVVMRHAGSNTDALRTKVGIGAKLTVEDGPDGRPRFRPYRPYPLALSPHKRKTDLPLSRVASAGLAL